jgi:hypothetical protein
MRRSNSNRAEAQNTSLRVNGSRECALDGSRSHPLPD